MNQKEKKCRTNSSLNVNNSKQMNSNYNLKGVIKKYCVSDSKEVESTQVRAATSVVEKKLEKLSSLAINTADNEKEKGKSKQFKWGERLEAENLYREFKNFNCTEITKEQYKILTKGICAFLNTEGGKLYLGVDNSGRVIGRQFTIEGMKKFENKLLKMLSAFAPEPPTNAIKIKFYRILDTSSQQLLDNRYVVIIKTKKGPIDALFMDQDGKSYYRLDGQTQKYSPEEYHEELLVRATQKASLDEYEQTQTTTKTLTTQKTDAEIAASMSQHQKKGETTADTESYSAYERDFPAQLNEETEYVDPAYMNELERQQYEQLYENQRGKEDAFDGWNPETYGQGPGWGTNTAINNNYYGGGYIAPTGINNYAGDRTYPIQQQYLYAPQMFSQQENSMMYQQNQYYAPPQYTYDNTQNYDPPPQYQQQYQNGGFYSDKEVEDYIKMMNQVYDQQNSESKPKKEGLESRKK